MIETETEAPVLEDRKPGRPKVKPVNPYKVMKAEEGGITRFRRVSALNVDNVSFQLKPNE